MNKKNVVTPLPGRPENVAFGTVLPGEANGMIRGFPRRADDICPYGAGVVFAPVGEAISLPQTSP
ncbi:MAG: hypothetical protein IJY86_00855, partial [Clostridia bacterium]|nr:hypothetical protein [Clostridia bacterium]